MLRIILVSIFYMAFFTACDKSGTIDDDKNVDNDGDHMMEEFILPAEYVTLLGRGFNATWAEFNTYSNLYDKKMLQDIKNAGFGHLRIRVNEQSPDTLYINMLKQRIKDCLDIGIIPIIAYQGHYIEEIATTEQQANDHLASWWKNMAIAFKDYPAELAFNVVIEISGTYKKDYMAYNNFYKSALSAIREISPTRIVIFPPVNLSDPEYLKYLEIPGDNDKFTLAEWHFYAAGPSKDSSNKKYWLDGETEIERENIKSKINIARQWMQTTGFQTWVGAWMAGNYNKENEYSIPEQVQFASYMTRELDKASIPFGINADNKYYDFEKKEWYNTSTEAAGIPVRDAILDPNRIVLYKELDYRMKGNSLKPGKYDATELAKMGIGSIGSIMIPFDYEVKLWSNENFTGDSHSLNITMNNISNINFKSIEVIYLARY